MLTSRFSLSYLYRLLSEAKLDKNTEPASGVAACLDLCYMPLYACVCSTALGVPVLIWQDLWFQTV